MHPQTPRVRRGPSISFGERSGGHVSEGHVIRNSLVVSDLDIHRQTNCSSKRSLRQAGAPARLRLQVLFKESEECRYNGVPILGRCCLVIDDRDESVTRGNDLGPDLRLLPEFGAQTE